VQIAREEAKEFVIDRTETNGTDVLVVTTDEATYSLASP
jgi:hypothetical protein